MEWGVIPFYTKDEQAFKKQRLSMANIRSERVLDDKQSYWYKIRNRRCLIPVNGFYEYRGVKGWKNKVPYYIHLKDQPVFFLPGLYSVAQLPDENGEVQERWTYALITRPANSLMHKIHNAGDNPYRMPLMLPFEMSQEWINQEVPEKEYRNILDYSIANEQLDYYTVYSLQSPKGRPDGEEKDTPFTWEKLPALGEAEPQ
jgi:putative SOS response-associated peptidase YedK